MEVKLEVNSLRSWTIVLADASSNVQLVELYSLPTCWLNFPFDLLFNFFYFFYIYIPKVAAAAVGLHLYLV
jgi:hypothetical protein